MIEEISGLPDGTVGVKVSGRVSGEDYDRVLTPLIEAAIEQFKRIKLLVQVGPEFEGYSLDAAWDDTKLGLRYWSGFSRVAVVTDVGWVRTGVKAIGFMMPCPVKLFPLGEMDEARLWLSESLGSIHINGEDDVVIARLLGKLEPEAYDNIDEQVDQLMGGKARVKLLLDLREFDGWSGIAALGDHLSLVREHYRVPERVAVVGDKAWQKLAEIIMSRFVNGKTKFFDTDDYDGALAWIRA